jgi:hypothetical protein
LKKITTRKLVVDRETVKTLLTGTLDGRLREVQGGGAAPVAPRYDPSKGCSHPPGCNPITMPIDQA